MKKRCAFTLVEMLIVMLLLTILVGLAWPMLRSPWGQTKLEDAAEKVRAAMADARREAITSVEPWQFCYRPGSSDYLIGPLRLDDDESTDEADTGEESVSLDLDQEEPSSELTIRQLPHGVTFCDPQVDLAQEANIAEEGFGEANSGESQMAVESSEVPLSPDDLAVELESGEWSKPIVFFPNGRSTSERFRLRSTGPDLRLITIHVRGIIGAAKIGKPWRIQQLQSIDPVTDPTTTEPTNEEEMPL